MATALVGVECPICHDEAFQLLEREAYLAPGITVRVKVCARCARTVDVANEEKEMEAQMDGLSKAERRLAFQAQSYAWADELHGKKVVVYWDNDTHPEYRTPASKYHALGTAYRMASNAGGGWGQIKVVIDPSEYHRIKDGCRYTLRCPVMGCDMAHTSAADICGRENCDHRYPIMDGQRYGLFLNRGEDGSFFSVISWGCRKCLVLAE